MIIRKIWHQYVLTLTGLTANGKKLKDRVTIEPQTFCYLKEIELKIMKIQWKTQQ